MNESQGSQTRHDADAETGGAFRGLSGRQLIVPSIPLILLLLFCSTFRPHVTSRLRVQTSGTSTRDETGELSLQVDRKLVVEGKTDWRIGPFSVGTESVVRPYEEIPELNHGIEETRGLVSLIAAMVAYPLFAVAVWHQKWNSRWSNGPPLIPPGRAAVSIVCVVAVLAGVCWLVRGIVSTSVDDLSKEFSGATTFGWRMMEIFVVLPVAEELVFRTTLQRLLARRLRSPASVLIQAACFGALHLATPLHVLIGFIGGVSFGAIYAATNRISLSIATHCLSNAVFILLFL